MTDAPPDDSPAPEPEETWGDRLLVGPLKPRHRKLAELHAQGVSNNDIATKLDYSVSRVSILLSNHLIKEEVDRIRERIYQDTVAKRLKDLADPALNVIEECLNDKTNRWKENLKGDMAKWVVEKLDGKAMQKFDVGENTLALFMDKLDATRAAGRTLDVTPVRQIAPAEGEIIEIEPISDEKREEDRLKDWVTDLAAPRAPRQSNK